MRSPYEKAAEKEALASGFTQVDYKCRPRFMIRGYNVDYFKLFDNMFYNPETGELKLVQVKGHEGCPTELRERIQKFEITKVTREIWTYKANGVVKKEVFR